MYHTSVYIIYQPRYACFSTASHDHVFSSPLLSITLTSISILNKNKQCVYSIKVYSVISIVIVLNACRHDTLLMKI